MKLNNPTRIAIFVGVLLHGPARTEDAPRMPDALFGQWCITAPAKGKSPWTFQMIGRCKDQREMMIIVPDGTYDGFGNKCQLRSIRTEPHADGPIYHVVRDCAVHGIAYAPNDRMQLTKRGLLVWNVLQ